MRKAIGLALVVGGIVLLIYGLSAKDSVSSQISQTFTGSPTNKALWLLILGAGATASGTVLLTRPTTKI